MRALAILLGFLFVTPAYAVLDTCDVSVNSEPPSQNISDPAHIVVISTIERLVYPLFLATSNYSGPGQTAGPDVDFGSTPTEFTSQIGNGQWAIAYTVGGANPGPWIVTGSSQFMCIFSSPPLPEIKTGDECVGAQLIL